MQNQCFIIGRKLPGSCDFLPSFREGRKFASFLGASPQAHRGHRHAVRRPALTSGKRATHAGAPKKAKSPERRAGRSLSVETTFQAPYPLPRPRFGPQSAIRCASTGHSEAPPRSHPPRSREMRQNGGDGHTETPRPSCAVEIPASCLPLAPHGQRRYWIPPLEGSALGCGPFPFPDPPACHRRNAGGGALSPPPFPLLFSARSDAC